MTEAFLTVLVVANVLPILPVILRFTEGLDRAARNALLIEAVLVGNAVALAMALGGSLLLRATAVTVPDLRIAGGVILFVFATYDLLFNREKRKEPLGEVVAEEATPTVIPMAIPVMVGPAVLATVVVVAEVHGKIAATVAVAGNAAINAGILLAAVPIYARIGSGLGRALGKVMALILAALAVSMIRTGVADAIAAGSSPT
jgi:multiple antibiotic resistance protein